LGKRTPLDLVLDPAYFAEAGKKHLLASLALSVLILVGLPHVFGWDSAIIRIATVMALIELARVGWRWKS